MPFPSFSIILDIASAANLLQQDRSLLVSEFVGLEEHFKCLLMRQQFQFHAVSLSL